MLDVVGMLYEMAVDMLCESVQVFLLLC